MRFVHRSLVSDVWRLSYVMYSAHPRALRKSGHVIYVPPNTATQHFNSDPDKPARLISAVNRIFKAAGLNDLEQLEDAPEYRPGVTVTPEMVEQFLSGKIRQPA